MEKKDICWIQERLFKTEASILNKIFFAIRFPIKGKNSPIRFMVGYNEFTMWHQSQLSCYLLLAQLQKETKIVLWGL